MCPPPSDVSSASRPVSRAASHHGPIFRLPSHSIPWLPGLPPPSCDIPQCLAQSAQHPPHRYVFRCTAARSSHTASLPLLCRILWLHHCAFRHSAMPSSCSTLPTRCAMLHDVAWCRASDLPPPTRHLAWPTILLDLLSACTTLARYVASYLTCIYWFWTYFLYPLPCILIIRPSLQADPYPFLFGSSARYVSCLD